MRFIRPGVYLTAGLIFLSSCRTKPSDEWETRDYKFGFNPAEFKLCLQKSFNKAGDLENADSLKHFYALRDYHPVIMKSFEDSAQIFSLLNIIVNVKDHGLKPERYRYNEIIKELSEVYINRKSNRQAAYTHMANTEMLLSSAIVKYAHDIKYGAVSPAKIYSGSYYLPMQDSGKGSILKPLYQEDILRYLNSIQPQNQRYRKMQAALKYFESLEGRKWEPIAEISGKLKTGVKVPQIKPIAERLALLGFIDTAKVRVKNIDTYDSLMARAIAKFQRSQGMKGDGQAGKETVRKLNTKPSEYIEKIKLNLERFRLASYADSSRYLLVNIPDFYLYAIENGKEKLNMRVCTGKKSTKSINCETPLLHGGISHLVLNPTWTVPVSIVKRELYGPSVKDISYLRRKNFKVFRNGKQVSLSSAELGRYSPSHLPYTFVQNAGEGNALGKIKFMFDNNFSIYLHDTPTRGPFSSASRAVSHGCVRVEKPMQLAEYIIKDNSKWDIDFIKLETGYAIEDSSKKAEFRKKRNELRRIGGSGKTTWVKLEKKIPIYIDYFTAWVNEEGAVNLRDDVYSRDEILKKYLEM